jgi:sugar lactone lactonase YvrE
MTRRTKTSTGRLHIALLSAFLAAATFLLMVGSASALQYIPHTVEKTITNEEFQEYEYEPTSVAADQQSGDFYVVGDNEGTGIRLFKFDEHGNPTPFTDPSLSGASEIQISTHGTQFNNSSVAVDNSGGPYQGRIYVTNEYTPEFTWAFEPSGAEVGGKFPLTEASMGLATSPVNGNFFLSGHPLENRAYEYGPDGKKTGVVIDMSQHGYVYDSSIDSGPTGDVYAFSSSTGGVGIAQYNAKSELLDHYPSGQSQYFGVDPVSGAVKSVREQRVVEFDAAGDELPGYEFGERGREIAINGVNHYDYVIDQYNGVRVIKPEPATTIASAEGLPPTEIEPDSVTVNFDVEPEGVPTTKCKIEFGDVEEGGEIFYEEEKKALPCEVEVEEETVKVKKPQEVIEGNTPTAVSAPLTELRQGGFYFYRIVLTNANGTFKSKGRSVTPSAPPVIDEPYVDTVHSDSVVFHADITPEGGQTTYHVLYGTADCEVEPAECQQTPESASIGKSLTEVPISLKTTGLKSGTTYHYIVVATNQSGTVDSSQETFTTFPVFVNEEECENSHDRQQTGAAQLADCRAYELVSAAVARYDVESYLTPEQEPFGGYPEASGKVLYGVHDGAIPGSGNPTNHGVDPYVATRGTEDWTTKYIGIPANRPYSDEAFASPVSGADASLNTFAFGGAGLCSPCFEDGSTGIPVALPDGSLLQGMQGSLDPGTGAAPNMLVKKRLSADGKHLIFGSTDEFEAGAGSPAIYDRDLETEKTHAISRLPGGGAIPCLIHCTTDGLAELDISADGSRVVIGQLISTDSVGNDYWHLYINVGDSTETIDLTPGATDGTLYDGMTKDGSKVFFTTADQLDGEDTDNSADIYEAQVGVSSVEKLHLVSLGSEDSGNSDSCNPLSNSVDAHWNTTTGDANCDAVAVGGGGGVAAQSGAIFFLSPELLDGTGEPEDGKENQPNLYRYQTGSSPQFVATLDSIATAPNEPVVEHRLEKFINPTPKPEYVAVDNSGGPSDGDVYVADTSENKIRKYDSNGNLISSWKNSGVLEVEFSGGEHVLSGIAVGPGGALWVANHSFGCCALRIYDENGTLEEEDELEGAAAPIGITVDNNNRLFYQSFYSVVSWKPNGFGYGTSRAITEEGKEATGLAVDPETGVFFADIKGVEIVRYEFDSAERMLQPNGPPCLPKFGLGGCPPTSRFGFGSLNNASGLSIDPETHDLYVDEGNKILRFHTFGKRAAGPDTGSQTLSGSTSVAVHAGGGKLYATNAGSGGTNVAVFGPLVLAPDPTTDNPIVIHGVNDAGTRYTGDFQINDEGEDGVFVTAVPLTGFTNAGHEEVFRYDAGEEAIDCVSCNPTGARAVGESGLARNGLSLTNDGRVFFDSSDPLLPNDLDNREDVFEWNKGKVSLISTGLSPFNSSLLTVTSNGLDADFFTRDTLVKQDLNGSLVKIYDARENGGFPYTPPPVECKASDECHGAGTPSPEAAKINTITGTAGNHEPGEGPKTCSKGKVKKNGKCVKKQHKKKHHKKRSHGRRGGK